MTAPFPKPAPEAVAFDKVASVAALSEQLAGIADSDLATATQRFKQLHDLLEAALAELDRA